MVYPPSNYPPPVPNYPPQVPNYPPQVSGYPPAPPGYPAQGGYPPGPGGYPPPPGPPFPPGPGWGPPRRRRSGGWIAGIVVGAVVLALIGTIGVVLLVRSGTGANDPSGDRTYGYVEDFCEVVDLSPLFDLYPADGPPWGGGIGGRPEYTRTMTCNANLAAPEDPEALLPPQGGQLLVAASVYRDHADAATFFAGSLATREEEGHVAEEVDGRWQEGRSTVLPGSGGARISMSLLLLDDNLVVSVSLWPRDSVEPGPDAFTRLEAAILQIAENVTDLTAASLDR